MTDVCIIFFVRIVFCFRGQIFSQYSGSPPSSLLHSAPHRATDRRTPQMNIPAACAVMPFYWIGRSV